MSKKINTHKLLVNYRQRVNYSEIAQFAGKISKTHDADQILDLVKEKFGAQSPKPSGMTDWKNKELNLFGNLGSDIPYNAYEQMQTAMSIEPAIGGALMPDAHHGYSVPIGGVVVMENAISPAFIGFDISCMVKVTILDIPIDDFMYYRKSLADGLRKVTSFGLGSDFAPGERKHKVMDLSEWNDTALLKSLRQKAQTQLGSSGGGNHFADLLIGKWKKEFTALMTHSGSRGTGHKIATHYTKLADEITQSKYLKVPKGYGWLDMDSDAGQEYYRAMHLMGLYAEANHELIHDHFLQVSGLKAIDTYQNKHNFAWREGDNYIHRKGATPAKSGQIGIIPGTSGTHSYIVKGLGNAASYHSSSHGAGRPHSRTKAKELHNQNDFTDHMKEKDILHFGLNKDETYQAYKDIETVIDAQEGILLEKLAVMQPKVVIMGGKSDDGD